MEANIGSRIQRDYDNSAALNGVHPKDYPHDIYLNGDQYMEWINEMIDTYARLIFSYVGFHNGFAIVVLCIQHTVYNIQV